MSLAILAWAQTAHGQDPFLPGLRWTRSASASDPWIPKSVALGADENEVWVAAASGNKHLELLALPGAGNQPPILRDDSYASALGVIAVSAGGASGAFYSVSQFPNPDGLHRSTVCERHDPVLALTSGSLAPVWSHDAGFLTNGAARMACDRAGANVLVAEWDAATHEVQVELLDGASGTLRFQSRLPAAALNELALSADGQRITLAAGLDLWVLDAQGTLLHHETLATSTNAIALSGDGARLALGGSGSLRLFEEQAGGGYTTAFTLPASAGELAARVALSRDGRTLALAWWNAQTGRGVRLQLVDAATAQLVWEKVQNGLAGGPQNLPEAVCASDDGERAAFGCWGDGTNEPELNLVDRTLAAVVLSADLPGSVQGLALDAHGQRLVVTHKDVHANTFGSTGSLRLYDTGERDLVLRARAEPGGTLELSARHAGAGFVFFLEGPPSPVAQTFPNAQGVLWLRRNALTVTPRAADAQGRADLSLPLPAGAQFLGTERHFQAAFRVQGVLCFGATVLDALIL